MQRWGNNEDRDVIISNAIESRHFVLIAGADKYNNNDAFRIAGLTVNCDPRNCEPTSPQPVSPASVPAPGTLALLATGALPGRRRLRTDHS